MKLNTKHFGEIDIDKENIIFFSEGIPGFEKVKNYIIIKNPDENIPFNWLQSIDDPELAFVITNPFIFRPDYDINITESTVKKLQIKSQKDISIWIIVNIPEETENMTGNLKAPIIINNNEKLGKQVLIDKDIYHRRHYILQELKGFSLRKEDENANSK